MFTMQNTYSIKNNFLHIYNDQGITKKIKFGDNSFYVKNEIYGKKWRDEIKKVNEFLFLESNAITIWFCCEWCTHDKNRLVIKLLSGGSYMINDMIMNKKALCMYVKQNYKCLVNYLELF